MPKVLIADALSERAAAIFAERGIDADVKIGLTPETLKDIIGDYDGLAVRSATKVTKAVLERAGRLKVVGRAGIGVDNIDVAAATQRGIVVMNTPFGNSITTAEHAIAMMFALARQLPAADRSTQSGKWEKSRFMGVELAATRNIIDAAAIAKMKPGVRIINCARGGLIVEADLKAALDDGHVAGAALDVFVTEPAKDNPLFGREELIATPHLGAATSEAQENVALQIAEQMADFLISGAVVNALNMPALSAEEATRLKPYMRLAEQLGSFAGQMNDRGITEVSLEYEGHVAELNIKPLTAVALTALLSRQLDTVNMVNVGVLCRERDIRVSETTRAEPTDYQTLLRLVVTTDGGAHRVAGTLYGGDKPRLVEIEDIAMEAELGPHMLFVRNKDKPGFIGNLGRALAEAGVNIATFHLGRAAPGADAICLVQVDEKLSDPVLDQVCSIPDVVRTKALRF